MNKTDPFAELRKTCKHNDDGNMLYRPNVNEAWTCFCQTDLGFRPDLDRRLLEIKIRGLLFDLHESRYIYVSNGSMGDIVVANTADECRKQDRYDQATILKLLLSDANIDGHIAEFWANRAERWLMEHPSALKGGAQ